MASVKVAVRVRPINQREINLGSTCIISMEGKKTSITNMKIPPGQSIGGDGRERVKSFTFDYSYWSVNSNDRHFASQKQVFDNLGTDVLQSAFEGYNACIFAYGQTGSGKSFTMMGSEHYPGLIPRICEGLYERIKSHEDDAVSYRTEVSYLEIYCERVRDLLRNSKDHSLKVREHPRDGPYVQNLSKHIVSDYHDIQALMDKGNEQRTTASTNMNDVSSRSHAIFTIKFTQAKFNADMPSETVSKINLVDLAGSERADATGATGERLKEGANINKSLVTLGNVISALADVSSTTNSPKPVTRGKRKSLFIPYRDSVLTWLLKDSLGGNSKTIMVATISPADVNYGETLSTLRYANRAKNIINKPCINEDPNVKLIRELRAEIARLKLRLGDNLDIDVQNPTETSVVDRLHENEERVKILTEEWATKWKDAQKLMQDKNLALRSDGNTIMVDFELPHLISIDDDILSTGLKLYHIHEGKTTVGNVDANVKPDIALFGHDVEENHCYLQSAEGKVWLHPAVGAVCALNGEIVVTPMLLTQGSLLSIGKTNLFRFNHPADAQRMRHELKSKSLSDLSHYRSTENLLASTLFNKYGLDREKQKEEMDALEDKRTQIEELQQKYLEAEKIRQQKLDEKEKELKDLQKHLEAVKEDADKADAELRKASQQLSEEKKRLARRSVHLMDEVEKFNQEREQEKWQAEEKIKNLQEEKRLLVVERDEVIAKLEEEKRILEEEIAVNEERVGELEQQKSEALYEVKKELLERRGALEEKMRVERTKHSTQMTEMDAKGKDLDRALKEAQQDFETKRVHIQRERDEERHFLDMESQKLDALRAKQQLAIKLASEMEESVRQKLRKESHEIAKARDEFERRKQAQLEALEEAEKTIESKVESLVNDIWESRSKLDEEKNALDKQEQEKKALLENSREKLTPAARELLEKQLREIEEDKTTIDDAVRMLDEQEENVEKLIELEFVELEKRKKEDQDKLEQEWRHLMEVEAANLDFVEQEVIDRNKALQTQRDRLSEKEAKLKEFQSEQSKVLNQLSENKRVFTLEKHRLSDAYSEDQEKMEKELSALQLHLKQVEDSFLKNTPWENDIQEQKNKLDALEEMKRNLLSQESEKLKTDEAVLKRLKDEIEDAQKEFDRISNYDKYVEDQIQEQEEVFKLKLEKVKEVEDQTAKTTSELTEQKQEYELEKKRERATIEAERIQLQEIQKQERMQRMVEEQVKQRLREEMIEREKELVQQQQKEMEERAQMMAELREAHQKEIKELMDKLRRNSVSEVDASRLSNGNILSSSELKRKEYLQSIDQPVTYNTEGLRDPIKVSIPKYLQRGNGWDSYHEFEVHITVLDETWVVYRRYSKFRELHDYMRNKYPQINTLQFPPKRLFGNKSEKVVQRRRIDLENYLKSFITICQKISKCPIAPGPGRVLSKQELCDFSPFFRKGSFETSKYVTG